MQADGRGWLYAPAGVADGPLPTHYEPQDSPVRNPLYRQQRNPARQLYEHEDNRYHPDPGEPGADVFPFVVTTYRLTEHFTAGGMSRWTPYLAELQPEFFCEVSPSWPPSAGSSTAAGRRSSRARGAIEARVLVTERMTPLHVDGRTMHQIGMPFHWGPNGYARGDATNELSSMALDPSSHIQEVKALTVDIRPGRRPRGRALTRARRAPTASAPGSPRRPGWSREPTARLTRPAARRRPRSGDGRRPRRPAAADGLLHRHVASASAARRARSPARSGTQSPRTGWT